MPNESDNESKMHELLQAYARKRQQDAGAPAELHPAARRLFQAEVRNQFGGQPRTAPTAGSGWTRLLAAWPRWTLALGIFLTLGLVTGILVHRERPSALQLAQNNAPARRGLDENSAPPASTQTPSAAPRAEGPVLLRQTQANPTQSPELDSPKAFDQADAPALAAAQLPAPRELNKPAQLRLALTDGGAPIPEMPKVAEAAGATPSQPLAVVTAPTPGAPPMTLGFTAASAAAGKDNAQSAPVLTNFEFQQIGEQVRVIDADGSVYDGKVLGVTRLADAVGVANVVVPAGSQSKAEPARPSSMQRDTLSRSRAQGIIATNALANYTFQVRGTNLRSQQSVELDGVLTWSPGASISAQADGQATPLLQAPGQAQPLGVSQGAQPTQGAQPLRFYRAVNTDMVAQSADREARSRAPASNPITNPPTLQRIRGTFRVGGGNAQPIDAVPAGR